MSRILTTISYCTVVAVTIIATGGIAVPAWLVPALSGLGAIAGHLATSPVDQTTVDVAKLTSSISASTATTPDPISIAAIVQAAQVAGQAALTAEHQAFLKTPAGGGTVPPVPPVST